MKLFHTALITTVVATLTCCAIPILLVSLGLGSTLAALFSTLPFLTVLSHYKGYLFVVSGLMLFFSLYHARKLVKCDKDQCNINTRYSVEISSIAGALWLIGFLFAYVIPPVRQLFEI